MVASLNPSYTPTNWYWAVTGTPSFVWSSQRLAYVGLTDATYLAWLASGNTPTITNSQTDLNTTMIAQVIPVYLAPGLQIISTGTSALNATYALDPVTLNQIGAVARDAAAGLGFPLGLGTFVYPDITGFPHTFNVTQFTNLYKALRDYVAAVNNAVALLTHGNSTSLPTQPVTIP